MVHTSDGRREGYGSSFRLRLHSVITGSYLEVCHVKLDRTEEATEDQKKKRSVPSVSVSVEHPHVLPSQFLRFTLERKDSSVSAFMVHTKINVRILPSPLSWFTLERKDSSVSVFMVHTKINVRILPSPFPWFTLERKDSSVSVQK